jgi:hypothetical protein
MFMQHFVHLLGTESAEYLDMTSRGVFVHCTIDEGKLILDRILSVTPLEDLQFKAPQTCHTLVLKSTEPKPSYVCPGCLITRIATI